MRVLMLGWEFPPAISGGLGTACYGLTKALAQSGVGITFVVPRDPDAESCEHVEMVRVPAGSARLAGQQPAACAAVFRTMADVSAEDAPTSPTQAGQQLRACAGLESVEFVEIEARLRPYCRPREYHAARGSRAPVGARTSTSEDAAGVPVDSLGRGISPPVAPPDGNLFREVERYAHQAASAVAGKPFDVVHAHDWMTFPAAEAISRMSGAPLVVHVHSTEFDRSGQQIDQRIYDTEHAGLDRADSVIAVSFMTRGILMNRYGVPPEKITVIYSAVDGNGLGERAPSVPPAIEGDEKIVLFLGRITMQKGPEYFLAAARKVLQVYERVRFVMAGSGDMIRRTMTLASEMEIGDKVLFTGFLQGRDVERVFRSADLYVMPSVSEPFGIASLEAIGYDVPVLMSKQSGAAEVLRHVLKVDFWDIEEMANKIVAVLRHPPLHATLKTQARFEVRQLSWSDAARRCRQVYESTLSAVRAEDHTPGQSAGDSQGGTHPSPCV